MVAAVLAVALSFAVSLVMSGVASAFEREATRVLDAIGGESFLMRNGELGVFTTASVVPTSAAPNARPFAFWNSPIRASGRSLVQSSLIGIPVGWPSADSITQGRAIGASGEVVVDRSLGAKLGSRLTLADKTFTVVGLTVDTTLYGGQPVVFVPMPDAQKLLAGGADVTKGFVENGVPTLAPPSGLSRVSRSTAKQDLLRPLANAQQSLVLIMVLLWIVAAVVVGSVVFLSVLERSRDMAVFKAAGVTTAAIAGGVLLQACIIAGVASILAIGAGYALAPLFAMPVAITPMWTAMLPLIALTIAVISSLGGLRRVARIDPALAFGAAP